MTIRFSLHLFDLIGMGTRGLRGRLEVEDEALLFYAGLLAQHPPRPVLLQGSAGLFWGASHK